MASTDTTVLYVEDEADDVLFMRLAFGQEGLGNTLDSVSDGQEAIEYLVAAADRGEHALPSLVLLDLNLPRVSGFEVLEWVRKHPVYKKLPVIVFSSSMREEDLIKAKALGANEHLEKPNSGMLFGKVVKGLRSRWLQASHS